MELNLPGPLNVVSLPRGLPKEWIADRITVEPVTFKLPVLPKAGYQLRAEAVDGDVVVSTDRDIFVVTDRPLRAGQYGNSPNVLWILESTVESS